MKIQAVPWLGVGPQKYRIYDPDDPKKIGAPMDKGDLAVMLSKAENGIALIAELDVVSRNLAAWNADGTPANETAARVKREDEIISYGLISIKPKETYRVVGVFGESADVIVPFRASDDEIMRKAERILRGYPPHAIQWLGWADLNIETLTWKEAKKRRTKEKKKTYDINYQKTRLTRIYLRVAPEYKEKVENAADAAGMTVTEFVRAAIDMAIDNAGFTKSPENDKTEQSKIREEK